MPPDPWQEIRRTGGERKGFRRKNVMEQPFDRRDGCIWYDGKLVPWAGATLHVLSHGLHYASCVFEGERAYGGAIFRSTAHSERSEERRVGKECTLRC